MGLKKLKNATWRWQWAHLVICICDKHYLVTWFYLLVPDNSQYFPRYELFSSDFWSSPDYELQTESGAYESTVQSAQVGSKTASE